MPFAMCPICGSVAHLNVGDVDNWYAERHPSVEPGSLVPEPCFECYAEIGQGDSVVTRRWTSENGNTEAGEEGVVEAVSVNGEFGSIYQVKLASGKVINCPRQAVRKLRVGEG